MGALCSIYAAGIAHPLPNMSKCQRSDCTDHKTCFTYLHHTDMEHYQGFTSTLLNEEVG